MSLGSNIWGAIKAFGIKNKLLLVGIAAIVILFFVNRYNYNRYQEAKQDAQIAQANFKAASDTIRIYKTQDGSLNYQKLAYIAKSVEDLKKTNADLYTETQNLKGDIKTIQKAQLVVHTEPSTLVIKSQLIDSTIQMSSSFDTTYSPGNYHSLAMFHSYDLTNHTAVGTLLKDEIGFTAVTGLKKTDNGYEIFLNPKYPGLKVESLEGAIIDKNVFAQPAAKKRSRISIGGSIGWTPITYEFNTKQSSFNLTRVGATLGLNFNF